MSIARDELFIVNGNDKVNFSFPDTNLLATSPVELARELLTPMAEGQTALYDAIGSALVDIRTTPSNAKFSW